MPKVNEQTGEVELSDFDLLYTVDCTPYLEKKKAGGIELTYLSWSDAWAEVKKRFPCSNYWFKFFNDKPYLYDEDLGYMVFVTVQIEGTMHEMWLPVLDGANKAMKNHPYEYQTKNGVKTVQAADMSDINKAMMRCLVKCLAMHGLGLYVYSGEDVVEYTYEQMNDAVTDFMTTRQKLSEHVDIRSKEFEEYVCEKAGVKNITPEILVNIPGSMRRVTTIMKQILKNKEDKAKAEAKEDKAKDKKAKADETKADA